MINYILYACLAFLAGAGIPVAMVFNAHLASKVGSAQAAFPLVLFVSFVASLAYVLTMRPAIPTVATIIHTPPHYFIGGVIVAFYMFSVTYLIPRFGVGSTVMFVVIAQLCASASIDAWGLFGAQIRSIAPIRLLGFLVIMVGVVMAQYSAILSQRE